MPIIVIRRLECVLIKWREDKAAFPGSTGFSPQNAWRMRQFYRDHTDERFLAQFVRELTRQGKQAPKDENLSQLVREMVAADLRRAFPGTRGFSANNVWLMRQFFSEYSSDEFLEQAVQEMQGRRHRLLEQGVPESASSDRRSQSDGPMTVLEQLVHELLSAVPWGHHVELLKKIKNPAARLWYLEATARLGWSRNVLLNQIKAGAYERAITERKSHNFDLALPEHLAEQADGMLKSSYNLEFLGIRRAVTERALEDRLIERLRDFILELG